MIRRLRNKKGQGMSEYLIILALVAIATVGAVIFFADNVKEQMANLAEEISGETSSVEHKDAFATQASTSFDLANFTNADGR